MSRPGTTTTRSESPPTRSAPTDIGAAFWVGLTGKGNAADARTPIKNIADFVTRFGDRADSPYLYDCADFFFRKGGSQIFISRVFGPTPVKATGNIYDLSGSSAPGDVAITINAKSAGSWYNSLNFEVVVGDVAGERKLIITHDTDSSVYEISPSLAARADFVTWSETSTLVDCVLGASNELPRIQAVQNMASGTDDRANATTTEQQAAFDRFTRDLGPGQIAYPGMTTATIHNMILNHGFNMNRVDILDTPDTATQATLLALRAALAPTNTKAKRRGGFFWPWVKMEGVTPGTTRTIPPSAAVCAAQSWNDGRGISPNQPAAARWGILEPAIGLSQDGLTDTQYSALNTAGINTIRDRYGSIQIYGNRTATDPTNDAKYLSLATARLMMEIEAKGDSIAEGFVFVEIDGWRKSIEEYGGNLTGMLVPYWRRGSLWGEEQATAFYVNVGSDVNTDDSIEDGYLKASIRLKTSESAEEVVLDLVQQRLTEVSV